MNAQHTADDSPQRALSTREKVKSLGRETKAKTKNLLHLNKHSLTREEEATEGQEDDPYGDIRHDPAFDPSQLVTQKPSLSTRIAGGFTNGVKIIIHPQDAAKKLAASKAAVQDRPYLSEEADKEFLDAHDSLSRAKTSASRSNKSGDHEAVDDQRERVKKIEALRQSRKVAWTTSRHFRRALVFPKRDFPPPAKEDFYYVDEKTGTRRLDYIAWMQARQQNSMKSFAVNRLGHVDYTGQPPFDRDTTSRFVERILIASAPWQTFFLSLRSLYLWEDPARTKKWLAIWLFVWYMDYCVCFVLAYSAVAVLRNRFQHKQVEEMREQYQSALQKGSSAYKFSALLQQHGSDWVDPVLESAGPKIQLHLGDFADLLELDGGNIKGKELSQLQDEFNALRSRKTQLGTQIDNAKDNENAAGRAAELNRKRVQQSILDDAHIICATLSGSGHDMFQSLNIEFETVVVDEAAQCVEMSALIPLKYGCAKCILVGDPRQLPPTVFSKVAAANKLEQSLFVRMQNNHPEAVHLLDTQYRMHPDISAFPSAAFYEGRLLDGDNMANLRKQPWHASGLLAPYRFFDVQGQHQAAPKGHSLINLAEIEIAMLLYERLIKDYRDYDFRNKIGIITPYKSQLRELKQRFSGRYGVEITESIEFNTTDAFQGRESEIIIFSCVRASPTGSVGFLSDVRRLNVGITRAKSSLWILGNSDSLMRGQVWKRLLEDARDRNSYISGDLHGMLKSHSSSFPVKSQTLPKQIKGSVSNGARGSIQSGPTEGISSRAQGNGTNIKKDADGQKTMREESTQAMEGVRVKLEDKLASMRKKKGAEDVEMADADSARSGASTPTIQSEPMSASDSVSSGTATVAKPRTYLLPTTTAPQIIRKRKKPADPFMPQPNRKSRKE
ncbi:hypothetical protein D6C83_00795 [Aureobasidium pullulans]|uniref:P-loop containing nucleoside triphosphate hydrolase protein n=1 Tax=Aureobasidium pullulans TaxID=5580 RepID=A0A4T0EFV3_AURPU|nr:hypothetical protein D6C83_00795 [Aureobasidium pullulans]